LALGLTWAARRCDEYNTSAAILSVAATAVKLRKYGMCQVEDPSIVAPAFRRALKIQAN
jgi:hypothetical protein